MEACSPVCCEELFPPDISKVVQFWVPKDEPVGIAQYEVYRSKQRRKQFGWDKKEYLTLSSRLTPCIVDRRPIHAVSTRWVPIDPHRLSCSSYQFLLEYTSRLTMGVGRRKRRR